MSHNMSKRLWTEKLSTGANKVVIGVMKNSSSLANVTNFNNKHTVGNTCRQYHITHDYTSQPLIPAFNDS